MTVVLVLKIETYGDLEISHFRKPRYIIYMLYIYIYVSPIFILDSRQIVPYYPEMLMLISHIFDIWND